MKSNCLFTSPPKNKDRICSNCGSNKTLIEIYNNKSIARWYHNKDDYNKLLCCSCYWKIYPQPKNQRRKNWNRIKNRRLDFCGITIILSFELPREICEICGITRKLKRIDRHHYFYCIIMPWACTTSICKKCHGRISQSKIKQKNMSNRKCSICGSNETEINAKNVPHWYGKSEDSLKCKKCYIKERRKKVKYK